MGGKNDAPAAPDYSAIAEASQKSSDYSFQLGQDQLAWAKQQDAQNQATAQPVIQKFLAQQAQNDQTAQADRARYQNTFQPLENQLASDATNYASTTKQQQQAGEAEAGITQQFDVQRNQARQNLESFGIDPSATRYAALDRGMGTAQAAATAGAGNKAINDTVQQGMALRSEAINVGRGYPGQIAQQYGTASQGGTGAVSSGLQTTASGANTLGTTAQYQGLGNQALGQWGNTLNQGYQNQLGEFNANQNASSGWGSALGLIGGIATKATPAGWFGMADGGMAGSPAQNGAIPNLPQQIPNSAAQSMVPQTASPTGGHAIDDVPAKLTAGEFVLPKDVVSWKGEEFLQNFLQKSREAIAQSKQQPQGQPKLAPKGAIPQAPTYASPGPR